MMRHSPSDGVDPRLIIRELRDRFLPKVDVDILARLISNYLKTVQRPFPGNDVLARRLSLYLLKELPSLKTRQIRQLIENRPLEFASLVRQSDFDERRRIVRDLPQLPIPARGKEPRKSTDPQTSTKESDAGSDMPDLGMRNQRFQSVAFPFTKRWIYERKDAIFRPRLTCTRGE
jgi:hypothetical protein